MLSISRKTLTPSEQVDHVWHLHIQHNQHYEEQLSKIMKNFLHHNPTEGGDEQQGHWNDVYGQTLKFYEKVFREKAP